MIKKTILTIIISLFVGMSTGYAGGIYKSKSQPESEEYKGGLYGSKPAGEFLSHSPYFTEVSGSGGLFRDGLDRPGNNGEDGAIGQEIDMPIGDGLPVIIICCVLIVVIKVFRFKRK